MSTNVEQKMSMVAKLEQSPATQIVALPEVADRFRSIYAVMNGSNAELAEAKYEAEKFHFMKLLQDTPALQSCTKLSLYGCFLDMAVNGLSFDKNMKHAYVVAFNTNVGNKDDKKWEKRATLMVSGYGELHMRVRQGQIKHADNPILVYDGDHFQHGTKNGHVFLEHVATFPRKSDEIIACYIRLQRNDDTVDYKVLSIDEVMKLKAFSKDPNSLAWTSGLPGMIQAKTLKHAFRSYPKMRMGEYSQLQSNVIDEVPEAIDYGLDAPAVPADKVPSELKKAAATAQENDESFDAPATKEATVTFDDDNF